MNKPVRALFGSRNAYRGALRQWKDYWLKWRQKRKADKKKARKLKRAA